MSAEELSRTVSFGDYLIILPSQRSGVDEPVPYIGLGVAAAVTRSYSSANETALTQAEIETFLLANRLLPELSGQPPLHLVAAA